MFRKELMKVGLIAAISLFSLVGCSGEEETKPGETTSVGADTDEGETGKETQKETKETTTGDTTEENTTGEASAGKFDPADVCKNISINGEIVEFPWTLNKLGDEYGYSDILVGNEEDQISGAYLTYKGEKLLIVNVGDEVVGRDSQIVVMTFSPSDDISVYDLGVGATKEDVVKEMGEPNEIKDDGIFLHYTYLCDEMKLDFKFYEDILSATHINVYGDWK